ncbi:hypothetical protein STEG23_005927 [Scotinomys teguina]
MAAAATRGRTGFPSATRRSSTARHELEETAAAAVSVTLNYNRQIIQNPLLPENRLFRLSMVNALLLFPPSAVYLLVGVYGDYPERSKIFSVCSRNTANSWHTVILNLSCNVSDNTMRHGGMLAGSTCGVTFRFQAAVEWCRTTQMSAATRPQAKMGRRQCKSAYSTIKNKTTPESSPPPTPKSDHCNADKAEENDLKKSLMKMLEEAFEEKMKNVSKEIGENTNKKLEEINKEIEEKKSKKLEEMNNEIEEKKNKKLEEMNNEIEEKKNKRVEEMNKEIEEKRNKKLQELDKEIEEKINKKLKEMNKEIEEKTNKKLEEINKVIEEKTNKKLDEINKEIEDKTNKKLEKINKEIDGKKTKELEEMKKEIEEKVSRQWGK